jgi:hypothetical protein
MLGYYNKLYDNLPIYNIGGLLGGLVGVGGLLIIVGSSVGIPHHGTICVERHDMCALPPNHAPDLPSEESQTLPDFVVTRTASPVALTTPHLVRLPKIEGRVPESWIDPR